MTITPRRHEEPRPDIDEDLSARGFPGGNAGSTTGSEKLTTPCN